MLFSSYSDQKKKKTILNTNLTVEPLFKSRSRFVFLPILERKGWNFPFLFLFFISMLKKKGYIFIKNRINTGKVDTRIFATGRENMVAKRVTHIFLHQLLLHILWKERKEGRRKGGKNLSVLCVLKINAVTATNCTGCLRY